MEPTGIDCTRRRLMIESPVWNMDDAISKSTNNTMIADDDDSTADQNSDRIRTAILYYTELFTVCLGVLNAAMFFLYASFFTFVRSNPQNVADILDDSNSTTVSNDSRYFYIGVERFVLDTFRKSDLAIYTLRRLEAGEILLVLIISISIILISVLMIVGVFARRHRFMVPFLWFQIWDYGLNFWTFGSQRRTLPNMEYFLHAYPEPPFRSSSMYPDADPEGWALVVALAIMCCTMMAKLIWFAISSAFFLGLLDDQWNSEQKVESDYCFDDGSDNDDNGHNNIEEFEEQLREDYERQVRQLREQHDAKLKDIRAKFEQKEKMETDKIKWAMDDRLRSHKEKHRKDEESETKSLTVSHKKRVDELRLKLRSEFDES